ncbi:hypothetical protein Tco_0105714 [Tanacetum coccineum]
MDANKKIDLDNPLCPNESKILTNILQNHPVRFSIAASSSVPLIYLGQFWHTLKEDGSKFRLLFVLNRKELTMTLDDFKMIFQLPQATNNNHERFVATPIFIKLIISHYMIAYLEISRSVRDKNHNLEHDEMVKRIFNSRNNKAGVRIKIPSWMITDEIKLIENYRMYAHNIMEESLPIMVDDYKDTSFSICCIRAHNGKTTQLSGCGKDDCRCNTARTRESSGRDYFPSFCTRMAISTLSTMKDNPQLQHDDLPIWLALKIKFEGLHTKNTPCRTSAIHPRDQDDPHDDAHSLGENNAKRQKTSEHGTYVFGESSSGHVNESEPGLSTSEPGDGITNYTRCCHTSSSYGVKTSLDSVSPHRINSDLEDSAL